MGRDKIAAWLTGGTWSASSSASRGAQDGEGHEEATVIDFYELLVGGQDPIPTVAVEFDDGYKLTLTARAPDVLPAEEEEGGDDAESESPEADAAAE